MFDEIDRLLQKLNTGELDANLSFEGAEPAAAHAPVTRVQNIGQTRGQEYAVLPELPLLDETASLAERYRQAGTRRRQAEEQANSKYQRDLKILQSVTKGAVDTVDKSNMRIGVIETHASNTLLRLRMDTDLKALAPGEMPKPTRVTAQDLDELVRVAESSERALSLAIDDYSSWWLHRFVRLLLSFIVILIVSFSLMAFGAIIVRALGRVYSFLREIFTIIEPLALQQAAWAIFLCMASLSLLLLLSSVGYYVYTGLFSSAAQRGHARQRAGGARARLTSAIVGVPARDVDRGFWSRLLIMVPFAIRRKLGVDTKAQPPAR